MSEFCEHVEEAIGLTNLTREQAREISGRKCPLCSKEKESDDRAHISGGSLDEYPYYWQEMLCGMVLLLLIGGCCVLAR